jgi:hypothetical protein
VAAVALVSKIARMSWAITDPLAKSLRALLLRFFPKLSLAA